MTDDPVLFSEAVGWPDTGHAAALEYHEYRMEFRVYRVYWRHDDGTADYVNDEGVSALPALMETASVWLEGHVKWDGCVNLTFPGQERAMLHFCTRDELTHVGLLLGRLYDLGAKIPAWQG